MTDKGQRSSVRTTNWSTTTLSDEKIEYAAKDGMASFILGKHMVDLLKKKRELKNKSKGGKSKKGECVSVGVWVSMSWNGGVGVGCGCRTLTRLRVDRVAKPAEKAKPFTSILGYDPADKDSIKGAMQSQTSGGLLPEALKNTAGNCPLPHTPIYAGPPSMSP